MDRENFNEKELNKLQQKEIKKKFKEIKPIDFQKVIKRGMKSFNFWENETKTKEQAIKYIKKITNERLDSYIRFKSIIIQEYLSKKHNISEGYFERDQKRKDRIIQEVRNGVLSFEEAFETNSASEIGMMDEFFNGDGSSQVINFNQELIPLLENTKIKKEIKEIPFFQIFFPLNEFYVEKIEVIGILIRERTLYDGLIKENNYEKGLEIIIWCLDHNDGNPAWIYEVFFEKTLASTKIQRNDKEWCEEKTLEKIKEKCFNITFNLINLINHPEVKLITISKEDERKNKNRKGLLGNPDVSEINLTGKIRKYFYETKENNLKKWKLGHKFWVRGHWVEFKNKRYKNMIGKKAWILPYIKGKGELIKKEYYIGKKEHQWKMEKKMFKILQELYPEELLDTHNRTILNGLEIDCYLPELKLGFEYNGEQHYNHIKVFHKTKEEFEAQKQRDIEKNKRAKNQGIKLITIKYDEELSEKLILSKLKEVERYDQEKK